LKYFFVGALFEKTACGGATIGCVCANRYPDGDTRFMRSLFIHTPAKTFIALGINAIIYLYAHPFNSSRGRFGTTTQNGMESSFIGT